jgi:hypothetical protein
MERELQEREGLFIRKAALRDTELTGRADNIKRMQEEVRQKMESVKSKEDENAIKQLEIHRMQQELQKREELFARKEVDLELKTETLKRGQAELEDKQLKWNEKTLRSSREVELRQDLQANQAVSSGSRITSASMGSGKERKGLFITPQRMLKAAHLVEQICHHLLRDTLPERLFLSVCRVNYRCSVNILRNHTSPGPFSVQAPPSWARIASLA